VYSYVLCHTESKRLTSACLLGLLAAGLALRLFFSYVVLPDYGSEDISLYSMWGLTAAKVSPGELYKANLADYPPGYLYVLWMMGAVSTALASALSTDVERVMNSLVKLPPMLVDIVTGFLLYRLARRWRLEKETAECAALAAAALYVLNPVAVYDSAIWGQSDANGALLMVLAMTALWDWPAEVAAALAVVALTVKPQFGVVLVALISTVLLCRHVVPKKGLREILRWPYWIRNDGPIRILSSSLVGISVFYIIVTPFTLNAHTFASLLNRTAQGYPYLTVNAFNPWALVGSGDLGSLMSAGIDHWSHDEIPLVGTFTGVTIGAVLLTVGFAVGTVRLFIRSDRHSIAVVGAYLCMCFFVLPTRVHERYLFPVFAFTALLAAFDRKWLGAHVLLMVGSFMNIHACLSHYHIFLIRDYTPSYLDRLIMSPTGILIAVVLQTWVFVFSTWRLRLRPQQMAPRFSAK
jgi:dolichyl-phosphate-mannose-protein mannosyltransferase